MQHERSDYVSGLTQLMTISCILAGFAFSGLIALPGLDSDLFKKIVKYFQGDFETAFYLSFYALFLATLCFLCTIMIILVYQVSGFFVPMWKLKRIHFVSNVVFSVAIACLMISVITFGMPSRNGCIGAITMGIGVAFCFIWENMVPSQHRRREMQIEIESQKKAAASSPAPAPTKPQANSPSTPETKES